MESMRYASVWQVVSLEDEGDSRALFSVAGWAPWDAPLRERQEYAGVLAAAVCDGAERYHIEVWEQLIDGGTGEVLRATLLAEAFPSADFRSIEVRYPVSHPWYDRVQQFPEPRREA